MYNIKGRQETCDRDYQASVTVISQLRHELQAFADSVVERFVNPYVKHFVTSIMLNSFPKYKTRDLPGLKTYLERKGELPKGLVLGLAGIITYYRDCREMLIFA